MRRLQPQVRESGKVSEKEKPGRDLKSGKPKAHRLKDLQDRTVKPHRQSSLSENCTAVFEKKLTTYSPTKLQSRRLLSKRPQVPLSTRLAYTNTIMNFS